MAATDATVAAVAAVGNDGREAPSAGGREVSRRAPSRSRLRRRGRSGAPLRRSQGRRARGCARDGARTSNTVARCACRRSRDRPRRSCSIVLPRGSHDDPVRDTSPLPFGAMRASPTAPVGPRSGRRARVGAPYPDARFRPSEAVVSTPLGPQASAPRPGRPRRRRDARARHRWKGAASTFAPLAPGDCSDSSRASVRTGSPETTASTTYQERLRRTIRRLGIGRLSSLGR